MTKEWARKEVAIAHNYIENISFKNSPVHENLAFRLNQLTENKNNKIADIGCGNGRLYNYLLKFSDKISYDGYDINDSCLEHARNYFRGKGNHNFFHLDIDNIELLKTIKDYDFVVFDSTLNMLEQPLKTIEILSMQNKAIVLDRLNLGVDIQKTEYVWGGMLNPSINWVFNISAFENIAASLNLDLQFEKGFKNSNRLIIKKRLNKENVL
jgi:SAM-dependent methyltransferase